MNTKTKVIYATDLDRTLIFSEKAIREYNGSEYSKDNLVIVEKKEDKVISYMSKIVYRDIQKLNMDESIKIVPVTSRSIDEYNRVNIGFIPEYAITSNGGVILHNGKIDKEYKEFTSKQFDNVEAISIIFDIEDRFRSTDYKPKIVDGSYIFLKTSNTDLFDRESMYITSNYNKWNVIRVKNKCMIIPNYISKGTALRWLWHKLDKPYIVGTGDTEADLPLLAVADCAIVPEHSSLFINENGVGYIEKCRTVPGGVEGPLHTIQIVRNKA